METWLSLLLALLLVLLNGFFVAAEFALVKVRSTRIAELANQGRGAARVTQNAIRHLDSYLSATQLGITLASIGLGWIGEPAVGRLLEPLFEALHLAPALAHTVSFGVAFALVSAAHIIVGELAPKSWAIQQPDSVSLAVAYPLHAFHWFFRPAIALLNGLAALLLRPLGIRPAEERELAHTEEELRMILTASGESGILKDSEVDLVQHVFEFADKKASDIMVPRVDMVYLDATWPLERNLEVLHRHTFTRYPLCEGGPDRVIGMIHVRDLLRMAAAGGGDLRTIRRDILFVPETKSIDQLLREFQLRKMHMAIVVDEYGGTAGLVTLEDVLEQIVGDIHDEHEEPLPEVQRLDDSRFLVDGKVLLMDLKADYEIELPPNGSETIGGWMLDHLGTIPQPGEAVDVDGYHLEVAEMDGQRVRKVLVVRTAPKEAQEEEAGVR